MAKKRITKNKYPPALIRKNKYQGGEK